VRVPVLDLRAQYAALRAEIEPVVLGLCESQGFIMGPEVEAFEREVAAYVRTPYAVGCASGTDALILALRALGVGHGHEVITTPFTFFASAGAVSMVGARPVFADIQPATFNLDPEKLALAITPRTRAIIAVDLFGQVADLTAILDVAGRHGIPVIEDAAQSLGAEHRGRRTGELALATFSFYPAKNLGGFGDGGMLATADEAQAKLLRQLRLHGESSRYVHERVGTNSRLDALQAAVLRIKLRHLDAWIAGRQRVAAAYTRQLGALGLGERFVLPATPVHATRHVYNQYTVRAAGRDALREHLTAAGVGSMVYYPIPLHLQPCFQDLGAGRGDFPESEAAAASVVSLPIYPELTDAQIGIVVDAVASFYRDR